MFVFAGRAVLPLNSIEELVERQNYQGKGEVAGTGKGLRHHC